MKRIFNFNGSWMMLSALLVSLLGLVACDESKNDGPDDDVIWDFSPVTVNIYLQDAEGNNLLSPTFPGNIRGRRIAALYEGKEYEVNWNSAGETRFYMPNFTGLSIEMSYVLSGDDYVLAPETSHLTFGEFDGSQDQDISLTLSIEDIPETWDITYTRRMEWKKHKPVITDTRTLNGETVEGRMIIVLPTE